MIDVDSIAKLNAIRYDADGDGAVSSGNQSKFDLGFPYGLISPSLGCNEDAADDADKVCKGYELTADLDFDTTGDGAVKEADHDGAWWDGGKGWAPIKDGSSSFGAEFGGNGHTIANLFIKRTSAGSGLFGTIVSTGKIRNVGLTGVNITARNRTGALAGTNGGAITASYAEGRVHATHTTGNIRAGGLVGFNSGTITGSYAIVNVHGKAAAGGLVGEGTGRIIDSYAAGSVSGHGTGSVQGESGGLVGNLDSGGRIDTSYAVGPVSGVNPGGLVAVAHSSARANNSYWDEDLTGQLEGEDPNTGQSTSEGGTGKTTEEMQALPPSSTDCADDAYAGDKMYCSWGDRWDFGDANHFPLLKADWDGDGTATVGEFGNQDREPSFADTATIANLVLTQDVAYNTTTPTALPEASGGNGKLTYSMSTLPDGLTFDPSTRILSGTPTVFQAKTATAYTVTGTDDGTDTISFTLGIAPPATTLAATAGNANVNLSWTAIAGVAGWEYLQSTGNWTAIAGSDDRTASHRVTGLTNNTAYNFKVRAFVGDDSASPSTRVDGVESNAETKTPLSTLDNLPTMASIAKQVYPQGAAITALVLPAATGGDGHPNYDYALSPAVTTVGLTLDSATRTISGTPSTPKAKTAFTWMATEQSDPDGTVDSVSRVFSIGIAPKKPAEFAAAGGVAQVVLSWDAIGGVTGWEYKQDSGSWTAISNVSSSSHTVTGLTNGTEYSFKVRAYVGTSPTRVDGVESDAIMVTPSDDLAPSLAAIDDKLYVQGEAVNETLPAATGGDGHPNYDYTLTPAVSGIGLTFTESTRTLSGTPSTPQAKTTYTYTATEATDPDGTTESGTTTFTIGVHPRKPLNFTATPGNAEVMLSWTAIAGVDGWFIQIDEGNWFTIPNSDATTDSYTRTTGLTNGTEYTFKVAAYVGTGDAEVIGLATDAATATPAAVSGQTSAPSIVTVTGGDSSLTVTWSWSDGTSGACPLNDGVGQSSGFELQYRQTGAVWRFPFATDPPDLPDHNNATNGGFELHDGSKRSFTIDANARGAAWPEQKGVTLTNGTEYEVRLIAYSDDDGCAEKYSDYSATKSATPMTSDLVPALTDITDQTYTQGAAVDFALPAATGGDSHPNYTYTLTPAASGSGLTFTASTHTLSGTPGTPKAKDTYTYKATESSDDDGTTESATKTFTIGIAPQKPASFTATAGNTQVTLGWTAITGVSGWEYQQDGGAWLLITTRDDADGHLVPLLTNNTAYTFKVRAFVGDSSANPSTRVNGLESEALTVTPAADLVPTLPTVDNKLYTQGTAVDETLPAATGGDSPGSYTYTLTPDVSNIAVGLAFTGSTHKLTGTPSVPNAKVTYTYTAMETSDSDGAGESASKTFTIGVKPKKPENFTTTPGDTEVTLSWTAIDADISGWEYRQDSGGWTAITNSDKTTNSHTVTGLTNGTAYSFKVRVFIGSGGQRVDGVESDAKTVTPSDDLVPTLPTVADQLYTQGEAMDVTLPEATGGDEGSSHPAYTYSLTPDVSVIGLTFNADDHQLSGRPGTPKAKTTFTYTATETGDSDGTNESGSKSFTIGIRPNQPDSFSATAGDAEVSLSWRAIASVSGWEYSKDDGAAWTAVPSSSASTTSYTVTGLTNDTAYTFKLRAFVGSGGTQVIGVSSDGVTATPAEITAPTFIFNTAYHLDDWVFTQDGELAVIIFPRVIPGHPDNSAFSHRQLRHLLSPAVPSGMVVDTGVPPLHNMGGYPDTPMAKTSYTYTVVEKNPDDGTEVGRVSWDFTISVKPKKPEGFTATAGNTEATLSWTAIAGVDGWEVKQGSGSWTAITGSSETTASHILTGLTNGTAYTFKVRAYIGTSGSRVDGVESATVTATPS